MHGIAYIYKKFGGYRHFTLKKFGGYRHFALKKFGGRRNYSYFCIKRGFRKWKAGEKLSESEDDSVRLEYRTDGTDAFDSLYIGCRYHLANMSGMCLPLGD